MYLFRKLALCKNSFIYSLNLKISTMQPILKKPLIWAAALLFSTAALSAQNLKLSKKNIDGIDKYGFVDEKGAAKIGYKFDKAGDFNSYDFARVVIGNQKYWLTRSGELLPLAESEKELNASTKVLDLTGQQLKKLPQSLKKQSQLQVLILAHNKIEAVTAADFAQLQQLEILDIHYNKISNLAENVFAELPKLQYLDFSDNNIEQLDSRIFAAQTELQTLSFSRNQIAFLDKNIFAALPNLQALYFAYNKVADLDANIFAAQTKLEYLDFSFNKVSQLDANIFGAAKNLHVLFFNSNQVSQLNPATFANLSQLTHLGIGHNPFTALAENQFGNTTKLKKIYIYNTKISATSVENLRQALPNCEVKTDL
jgi:Leucine-rich repeat (LRR) protein